MWLPVSELGKSNAAVTGVDWEEKRLVADLGGVLMTVGLGGVVSSDSVDGL